MRILRRWYGHLSLLITNVIFGLNMPVSRSLLPDVLPPLALNLFRMGGACVLFWIASLFIKKQKTAPKDLLLLFAAGLLGVVINQITFIIGLSSTSPVTASLITSLLPVVTLVLAFFFMKEPISWMKVIGIIIGASGALILILNNTGSNATSSIKGIVLIFISSLSYAFYLTLFKRLIASYHPIHLMKWMFTFALVVSLPICYNDFLAVSFSGISIENWYRIIYVVFFATFIAYLLIPIGQRTVRPTTLSMYNYLQPFVASALAVFWRMDTFGYQNILSAVLVFAGVYVVTQSKSRIQLEMEKRRRNIARIRKFKEV